MIEFLICPIAESKLLGQVQNIAVLTAAILFVFEVFDRKKQVERQAWQMIDGAQGSETSGARKQAILDLCEAMSDITGLDADGADLREIELKDQKLTGASFKKAILIGANFEYSTLDGVNFNGANLIGANLKGASLKGAQLKNAKLDDANLKGAQLCGANLEGARLYGAKLGLGTTKKHSGAEENTDFSGAILNKTKFDDRGCLAEAKMNRETQFHNIYFRNPSADDNAFLLKLAGYEPHEELEIRKKKILDAREEESLTNAINSFEKMISGSSHEKELMAIAVFILQAFAEVDDNRIDEVIEKALSVTDKIEKMDSMLCTGRKLAEKLIDVDKEDSRDDIFEAEALLRRLEDDTTMS
jgi:uncharacterized protein YjbI with pentapeptide repeats